MARPNFSSFSGGTRFNQGTGRGGGIRWSPDLAQFGKSIADLRDPIFDAAYARLRPIPHMLVTHARTTHEWTDRTGRATRGLDSKRRRGQSFMTVWLAHGSGTVSRGFNYGIALEQAVYSGSSEELDDEDRAWMLANDPGYESLVGHTKMGPLEYYDEEGGGSYAVVMPTLEELGPEVIKVMRGLLLEAVRKGLS